MLRFSALNEEDKDEDHEQEAATKEAQETIAESEYVRAMKLKYQGKPHLALSLLGELLQTKVLNEIATDDKNDKLWAIRYNCHKNIAIIHEEKEDFQMALQNYVLAMQIDDSDVYTMHRFGQLALRTNALELAEFAFDNCLRRNPLHWSAADGRLRTLCRNQNIFGAYGWALKLYRRDPENELALRTLREISTTFDGLIPFYEKIWGPFPEEIKSEPAASAADAFESVFPRPLNIKAEETPKIQPPDLSQFCMQQLNWLSLGEYIVAVYNHLQKTEQSMLFTFRFDDLLYKLSSSVQSSTSSSPEIKELPTPLVQDISSESTTTTSAATTTTTREQNSPNSNNSNSCEEIVILPPPPPPLTQQTDVKSSEAEANSANGTVSAFVPPAATGTAANGTAEAQQSATPTAPPIVDTNTNEDSDSNAKSDGNEAAGGGSKSKPRRRCSDLHFLEQWGWHKTRRRSKKAPQPDRTEVDTSLNGYLRKIFNKFTNATFEETWPFKPTTTPDDVGGSGCSCTTDCESTISLDHFQTATQTEFDAFIAKLKAKPFDLMLLIYKWLKHLSIFWHKRLPQELCTLYLNIYDLYLRHFDFSTWNQLSNNNIEASTRICALYLELEYTRIFNENGELSTVWRSTFNQLMFNLGCAMITLGERFEAHKLRLVNLEYLSWRYSNQLEKCVACLEHMAQVIDAHDVAFVLHVPNLNGACIRKSFVANTRIELQREISLIKVPKLFKAENWSQLADIIRDNILNGKTMQDCENWVKDFKVQIELLLQSFWHLNDYENCLNWAEKFLHYVTNQYLKDVSNKSSYHSLWSESINFIFSYIEALVLNEGYEILAHLEAADLLARLVQNTMRLLSFLLDSAFDRNNINAVPALETKRPWVVLHQVMLREENNSPVIVKVKSGDAEDDEELVPNSFLVLFTAHEFLGKRQWCTRDNGGFLQYTLDAVAPNLRAPLYDSCRDAVYEYIEQVTYCLYGYPQKKARSRHLEDHEAQSIELTWSKSIQLFDLYRPECLPEFNSYKLESISADMEQLLLKIVVLMPSEFDPTPASTQIMQFINGETETLPDESPCFRLPYKISSIFYLLADYYFKNRDFSKTIKYYMLDLAGNPTRFDSWAGVALSKASKIETKLNGLVPLNLMNLLVECEDTIRCFERCIGLDRNQTLLWIEYGSFTYTIHSYCSRYLKQSSENLSMEQFSLVEKRKDKMLHIAYNCFSLAAQLLINTTVENTDDNDESHEEKWLCQYMLGKIAEKRKEQPKIYLDYYLMAANYLYESSATYPIKINHSNPTTLSVEALEVFYRINTAIIKYIEHEKEVSREIGDLFNNVLKNLADSPFAYNKAKVDGNSINALKRKIADKMEQASAAKLEKQSTSSDDNPTVIATSTILLETKPSEEVANKVEESLNTVKSTEENMEIVVATETVDDDAPQKCDSTTAAWGEPDRKTELKEVGNSTSQSRRESQESAATGSTTTVTSSTTTSSSSSSDSSSSDSDSDSDASENSELKKSRENNLPYTASEMETLYKIVIQNLEECATRFPEHYKSIYRLVYHYLNGPSNLNDLDRCEQLLLGQYRTTLGNQINGVFYDRKNNNLFNGIWRIPSSEIDRPGSFSAHLVKCVSMLIQLLMKSNNHKLLIDVGLQLFKTPDQDKRYIKDTERIELYQQSIIYCAQILRQIFKENMDKRDDAEILNLLIDIYKIHKKCIKYMNHKEVLFTQLMIDVYKFYVQDKVDYLPEHLNFLDLAIKLCLQEIGYRKNMEKFNNSATMLRPSFNLGDAIIGINTTSQTTPTRTIQIPGLPMRNRNRPVAATNVGGLAGPMNLNYAYTSGMASQFTTTAPTTTTTAAAAGTPALASGFPTDLLKPTNFMSMMTFLSSQTNLQKDNADYQRLVAQYYKQILEGVQNEQNAAITAAKPTANLPPPQGTATSSQAAAASATQQPQTQYAANPLLSLASSLPCETTLTPSTPQSRLWQAEQQNRNALSSTTADAAVSSLSSVSITSSSCADLIITRAEPRLPATHPPPKAQPTPTVSIELQPVPMSMHSTALTATSTIAAATSSSSSSSAALSKLSADIFVRPLISMQAAAATVAPACSTQLMDLPKELTIKTLAAPPPDAAAQHKYQPKAKSASRSKPAAAVAKPYTNAAELALGSSLANTTPSMASPDFATLALLKSLNMDSFSHQSQLLSTYADLLKNSNAMQQFQMLTQKQQKPAARRPPAKRKPKQQQPQPPTSLPNIPTSTLSSGAAVSLASFIPSIAANVATSTTTISPPSLQSKVSSAAAYGFPMFESNGVTMTALPPPATSSGTTTAAAAARVTTSQAFPLGPMPTSSQFSAHSSSPSSSPFAATSSISISPTKTLQQKLAERQKANQQQQQQQDMKQPNAGNSEKKPHVDVIILD